MRKETTMRLSIGRRAATLLAGLILMCLTTGDASTATHAPPNPVVVFMGPEFFESGGKEWTRYRFVVENRAEYPNELFAAAPDLPPCGQNNKSSRTWVDINEQGGKRLNGFCALGSNNDLDKIWFALERDTVPPSWIYVELTDRKTGAKFKSNLVETTE